jgi:Cu-Zn family superoxide dismutase
MIKRKEGIFFFVEVTMRFFAPMAVVAVLALAVGGCESMGEQHDAHHGMGNMEHMHAGMWANVNRAVAVIYPTKGNQVSGTLWFDRAAGGVHIHGDITGLAPNSVHALHVHEFGDQSSADGTSAGSHYNPEGHHHGNVTSPERHAGDLGNIQADGSGTAHVDVTDDDLSIAEMKNPVIGRGVVVHEKADDFTPAGTGNAGGRLGVGVIGIAKSQ